MSNSKIFYAGLRFISNWFIALHDKELPDNVLYEMVEYVPEWSPAHVNTENGRDEYAARQVAKWGVKESGQPQLWRSNKDHVPKAGEEPGTSQNKNFTKI